MIMLLFGLRIGRILRQRFIGRRCSFYVKECIRRSTLILWGVVCPRVFGHDGRSARNEENDSEERRRRKTETSRWTATDSHGDKWMNAEECFPSTAIDASAEAHTCMERRMRVRQEHRVTHSERQINGQIQTEVLRQTCSEALRQAERHRKTSRSSLTVDRETNLMKQSDRKLRLAKTYKGIRKAEQKETDSETRTRRHTDRKDDHHVIGRIKRLRRRKRRKRRKRKKREIGRGGRGGGGGRGTRRRKRSGGGGGRGE